MAFLAPIAGAVGGTVGRMAAGRLASAVGSRLAASSLGRVKTFGEGLRSARGITAAQNLGENVGVNEVYSHQSNSPRQNFNDGLNTGGMY